MSFREFLNEAKLTKEDGDYLNVYTKEIPKLFNKYGIVLYANDVELEGNSVYFHISAESMNGSVMDKAIKTISKEISKNKGVDFVDFDSNKYIFTIFFDTDYIVELY